MNSKPALVLAFAALVSPGLLTAQAPTEETITLSPFTVTAEGVVGYRATNSISATRLATPLQDVPVNLQVVTQEFLADTLSFRIEDALQYSAGVSVANQDREQGIFNIRGFTTSRVKRNGFTTYYVHDLGNTERVEIVKGPSSLLYGEMEPGGVINYITRRPGPKAQQSLHLTFGSHEHFRATLESSGPIGEKVRYGITASLLDDQRWTDDWAVKQNSVNGVVQFMPWSGSTLTFEGTRLRRREDLRSPVFVYNRANYQAWLQLPEATRNAIIVAGTADQPSEFVALNGTGTGLVHTGRRPFWTDVADWLPRNWNTSAGDLDSDMDELAVSLETPLGRNHALRAILRSTETSLLWARSAGGSSRLGIGADGLRGGSTGARLQENEDLFSQVDFTGDYRFGFGRVRWVAGWERMDGEFAGKTWDRGTGATAIPWIYFNPALARTIRNNEIGFVTAQNTPSPTFPAKPLGNPFVRLVADNAQENEVNSFYGILQTSLFDERLHLLGGVRRELSEATDIIYVNNAVTQTPPQRIVNPEDRATVPQVGASVRVIPGLNVFASYSESFRPQRGVARDAAGNIFKKPPQRGEGTDVGFKFDLIEGRLSGTVSYFDITVRDIMGRETPPGGGTAYDIVIDGRKVDGWEFDGIWQQGNNQLILSYARVSGESLGDETGQRVPGLPQDRFAVWNKYSFKQGFLRGAFVAAGYSFTGDRLIGQNNNFLINDPSYDLWDLALGYDTKWSNVKVEFRLNVKNVLDEKYLVPGGDGGSFYWGDPRMIFVSTRFSF